ncbi:MAG: hypothetical protein QHH30_02715 [candidate division NC10 bacterium]|nr:hypothetical protein [candidate division NC10 bacterium]
MIPVLSIVGGWGSGKTTLLELPIPEKRFLKGKTGQEEVQLGVDGRWVLLNPFLEKLFHSLLQAMVSPLKPIGTFRRLSLRLDHPEGGRTSRP